MKFGKKKKLCMIMMLAACLCLPSVTAQAEEETRILEHFTSTVDNTVTFYLNCDAYSAENISVTYGNIEESVQYISDISSSNVIYTLILVDNSQSVMKKNQEQVMGMIKSIIENCAVNEKILVAEIEESEDEINYTSSQFSNDVENWKNVLDLMEIENKDADVFLNLSKAVKVLNSIGDTEYKRIIIVSDGIHEDEESAHYSKGEIDADLEKTNYPIYAIGVQKSNETTVDLQNLFSYSRKTGASYFTLKADSDQNEFLNALNRDFSYLKLITAVEKQPCDGSQKNVQLNINGILLNETVSLPVVAVKEEIVETKEQEADVVETGLETNETESDVIDTVEETAESMDEEKKTSADSPILIVILGAVGLLFVIVLVSLLIVIKNRKKKEAGKGEPVSTVPNQFTVPGMNYAEQGTTLMDSRISRSQMQPQETTIMQGNGMGFMASPVEKESESEGTMILSDDLSPIGVESVNANGMNESAMPQHRVVLKNLMMQGQEFSATFCEKIIVGRNNEKAELVIPDKAISGAHCEIGIWNGQYYIKDLQSSNGSFVNGIRCDDPTEIRNGCQIRLGRTNFQVGLEEVSGLQLNESGGTELLN